MSRLIHPQRTHVIAGAAALLVSTVIGAAIVLLPARQPAGAATVMLPPAKAAALIEATTGDASIQMRAVGEQAKLINASLPFAGGPVRSAGEMFFSMAGEVVVEEVSNLSTGFCPEPESWWAVQAALDGLGLPHPGRFTTEVVFRRCPRCFQRNVVKDDWFVCQVCGAELPQGWNFA